MLPFVAIFSLGTWTLLCNYMALRTVHGLSRQRSVAAALLPLLAFALLAILLGGLAAVVLTRCLHRCSLEGCHERVADPSAGYRVAAHAGL